MYHMKEKTIVVVVYVGKAYRVDALEEAHGNTVDAGVLVGEVLAKSNRRRIWSWHASFVFGFSKIRRGTSPFAQTDAFQPISS
jgi:hypothetical protein